MMVLWVWVIIARPIHEDAFDHVPHASQLWMVHVYYARQQYLSLLQKVE